MHGLRLGYFISNWQVYCHVSFTDQSKTDSCMLMHCNVLPRFSELGNTPKVENEDPLLVNPLVELCAGFVSKLNVSIFNYTAQTPGQGNQLLH